MWLALFNNAIETSNKTKVAEALGVSRTTISLIASGKYPASTEHIGKKVLSVYGRIQCPHLGAEIAHNECQINRSKPAPTSSAREMKHWRACQTCSHNTEINKGETPCLII